ncbi:hypothetical protein D3C85_777950 [compost metagenome]
MGDTIGGQGCHLDHVFGQARARRSATVDAIAVEVVPFGAVTVGTDFQRLATKAVVLPLRGQAIRTGQAGDFAETRIGDFGFGLAQRIAVGNRELSARIKLTRRTTGRYSGNTGRRRGHRGGCFITPGIIGVGRLDPHLRDVGLDNFLGQQSSRRIVFESGSTGGTGGISATVDKHGQ